MKKNLKLKNCKKKDLKFILDLYNHNVKKKLFNSNKAVSLKSHKNWFNKFLKSKKSEIYLGFTNKNIGYVRIENLFANIYSISIAISEEFIGKGYSDIFLRLSIDRFAKKRKKIIILSIVKKKNLRSTLFFLKNKFLEIKINKNDKLKKFVKKNNKVFVYINNLPIRKILTLK
jgi:L-amino acid N-acyltransferase YncA